MVRLVVYQRLVRKHMIEYKYLRIAKYDWGWGSHSYMNLSTVFSSRHLSMVYKLIIDVEEKKSMNYPEFLISNFIQFFKVL